MCIAVGVAKLPLGIITQNSDNDLFQKLLFAPLYASFIRSAFHASTHNNRLSLASCWTFNPLSLLYLHTFQMVNMEMSRFTVLELV